MWYSIENCEKQAQKFHSIINVSSSGAKRSKFQVFILQKETDDHTDPISQKLLVAITWLRLLIIPRFLILFMCVVNIRKCKIKVCQKNINKHQCLKINKTLSSLNS